MKGNAMTQTGLIEVKAPVGRRRFIAGTAAAATLASLGPMRPVRAATKPVRIGYVSPQTGPLAAFGEADAYTLNRLKPLLADGVMTKSGKRPVEIILRDSQSSPNRAAALTRPLTRVQPETSSAPSSGKPASR